LEGGLVIVVRNNLAINIHMDLVLRVYIDAVRTVLETQDNLIEGFVIEFLAIVRLKLRFELHDILSSQVDFLRIHD
jgi:hypothetical protein